MCVHPPDAFTQTEVVPSGMVLFQLLATNYGFKVAWGSLIVRLTPWPNTASTTHTTPSRTMSARPVLYSSLCQNIEAIGPRKRVRGISGYRASRRMEHRPGSASPVVSRRI